MRRASVVLRGAQAFQRDVLHTMDDTLGSALSAVFRAQGKTLPRDPTHVFIFYTAGVLTFYTAGVLTQRMIPGHVPYAEKNGLWARVADFRRALPVLQHTWQRYLDGEITFADAVQRYATSF